MLVSIAGGLKHSDIETYTNKYLGNLKNKKTDIIILDHHEIIQEIPENVVMINPMLDKSDMLSGAGICYQFAKTLSSDNIDLSNLAVIGMVGDFMDKNIHKTFDEILKDSGTTIKKGLMLYPSTKPLDKTLEYSSNPYIPGVTGDYKGVVELLRDANIPRIDNKFKSLYELTEEEMANLVTAIALRGIEQQKLYNHIGNLFLVKFSYKIGITS